MRILNSQHLLHPFIHVAADHHGLYKAPCCIQPWLSKSKQLCTEELGVGSISVYGFRRLGEFQTNATRRRKVNYMQSDSETYVYMEPGRSEEFVTEEELKVRLKGWLGNWPNEALPPDLARFETLDEAVTYLVKFVCELEIDGDVGSIQWYKVCLD